MLSPEEREAQAAEARAKSALIRKINPADAPIFFIALSSPKLPLHAKGSTKGGPWNW